MLTKVSNAIQAALGASTLPELLRVFLAATGGDESATVEPMGGDPVINVIDELDHGRVSYVTTVKGQEVRTAFKLVEASELITSNSQDGRINPDYPQELQPRDRTRAASVMQIDKLSKTLRPVQLADSGLSSHGAPIVGPDRAVESGNGRSMAIIKAYAEGNADKYRDYLVDNAELYGLKIQDVKRMSQPVLVRVRLDEVDRVQFAKDSNVSDLQSMSPMEQARVDAEAIDQRMLALFSPSEGGDLLATSNRSFIQAFMGAMASEQAAGLMTADGRPTRQVIDRVQAAIFAKAYQNEQLLQLAVEEPDPDIRNVLTALNAAAPAFIEMRYLSGEVHKQATNAVADGASLVKSLDEQALSALVEAATVVREAKSAGQDIEEYLSQRGLFGDVDPHAAALAKFIATNNRSAKRMGEAFRAMAEEINAELSHQGAAAGDMFGAEPLDLFSVLARVSDRMAEQYGEKSSIQVSMFDASGDIETRIAAARRRVETEPTKGQQLSGNYAKGHLQIYGLPITIENPLGSVRRGVDESGQAWESQMRNDYGYIKGTEGADGDQVDVFLGDYFDEPRIFIVNQKGRAGEFDEHKVMLGFKSEQAAHDAYLANYEPGWNGLGSIYPIGVDDFTDWLKAGTKQPYSPVLLDAATSQHQAIERVMREQTIDGVLGAFDLATRFDMSTELASNLAVIKGLDIKVTKAKRLKENLENKMSHSVVLEVIDDNSKASKLPGVFKDHIAKVMVQTHAEIIESPELAGKLVIRALSRAFYEITENNKSYQKMVSDAVNDVALELTLVAKDAAAGDVSGLGEINAMLDEVKRNSAITSAEAESMVRGMSIKIGESRLCQGYSLEQVRGDLKDFFLVTGGQVQVPEIRYRKKRAHANKDANELNSGRSLTKTTLWHEMGHFLEFKNPWILAMAKDLLRRRYDAIDKKHRLARLSNLTGNHRYGAKEIALDDGFYDPYVGKIYSNSLEIEDVKTTEVISMGMQCLANQNQMAEMATKDPEHLAMMLTIVKMLNKHKGE